MLLLLGAGAVLALALKLWGWSTPPPAPGPDLTGLCHVIGNLASADQMTLNTAWNRAFSQGLPDTTLPYPPMPHELLNIDIFGKPFSAKENNVVERERRLGAVTAKAVEHLLEKVHRTASARDEELLRELGRAARYLMDMQSLATYQNLMDKLRVRTTLSFAGKTLHKDTESRMEVLDRACGPGIVKVRGA